jgi:hypothetical protein
MCLFFQCEIEERIVMKNMSRFAFQGLMFIAVLLSQSVCAWTVVADFESGAVGSKAEGNDGFTSAFSTTLTTSEQVHSGSKAAKTSIVKGATGYGDWGGVWLLPSELKEGDEYWFRVWTFFPEGFDFSCHDCSEGVKFMRTRTGSASGAHEGYQNFFLSTAGMNVATSVDTGAFYRKYAWPHAEIRDIGEPVKTGQWHAFEVYLKFSATAGNGIFRTWQNGKLIFEDKDTPTLRSASSVVTQASVWTYWNNTAPKSQTAYIDSVVITSEQPQDRDANGNPFIGIGSSAKLTPSVSTAPKSPGLVSAKLKTQ